MNNVLLSPEVQTSAVIRTLAVDLPWGRTDCCEAAKRTPNYERRTSDFSPLQVSKFDSLAPHARLTLRASLRSVCLAARHAARLTIGAASGVADDFNLSPEVQTSEVILTLAVGLPWARTTKPRTG